VDYFVLNQDERIPYAVQVIYPNSVSQRQDILCGNFSAIKKSTVIKVSPSKFNYYPSILCGQLFLVKKGSVKEAIELYAPDVISNTIYLIDSQNKTMEIYYLPHLPVLDCYSDSSKANLDKSVIHELVLRKDVVPNNIDIFRVGNINTNLVVVSLRLSESILRRRVEDISFSQVATC